MTFEITRMHNNVSYMTHAEYDPTGRYILTSSIDTKSYQLWNVFGD